MPFKSEAQRRFMWAKHPEIAKKWAHKYGKGKGLPMHVDGGFFGHGTHASMQAQEDSVSVSGDGFSDSSVPKTPKTDSFYRNVSNWKR
jgi:hypothetical protein